MKTAIITGTTGQDGALLSNLLLNKDYRVIGIVRRTASPTDWRIKELGLYNKKNFHIASGDILDSSSIDRIVFEWEPDEFYNLAAMSYVGESWNTPISTFQINSIGALNCLEALRKHRKSCRYYQASTSEMFGGANRTESFNEDSAFYPRSPYGISKLAAYWSTINYKQSYDMFCCNGILFNHEGPYRGKEFVTRKITDYCARLYCGNEKKINLGNLSAKRDWGYAEDFVRGMWMMLQHNEPDNFILATNKSHSVQYLFETALKCIYYHPDQTGNGELTKYIYQDQNMIRPAEVGHLLGDYSKAKSILGWEPTVDFESMIKIMVQTDVKRVRREKD